MEVVKRFFMYVEVTESGCWNWHAYVSPRGYGYITVYSKPWRTHRFIYNLMAGNIAHGKEIDHLCNNKRCVNPFHLEEVTPDENMNRYLQRPKSKFCTQGHELTPENIYKAPNNYITYCRTCIRINEKRRQERNRAKNSGGEPT